MIYIGKGIGSCCSKTFGMCGEGCKRFCTAFWECRCCGGWVKLPFSTCSVLFSLLLGIPALIIAIYTTSESEHTDYCENNYILANWIQFANYFITIAFTIYAVYKIGEGYYRAYEKDPKPKGLHSQIWKFLCYDFVMLLFIFFYIWTWVWDIIVLVWVGQEEDVCTDNWEGVIAATIFLAVWHMCLMLLACCWFPCVVGMLGLSERSWVRPFLSACICGMKQMEDERQRRIELGRAARGKHPHDLEHNHKHNHSHHHSSHSSIKDNAVAHHPDHHANNGAYPQPQPPTMNNPHDHPHDHHHEENHQKKGFVDKVKDNVKGAFKKH